MKALLILAAVFWNVRVERIIDRHRNRPGFRREIDIDVSSAAPFWVQADGQRLRVDTSTITCNGGHAVLGRSQASFEETIHIEGARYTMPPIAWGSRNIKELALVPGRRIWVAGALRRDSGEPVIEPHQDRPVVIDTTSFATRRRVVTGVTVWSGAVGAVMLVVALVWGLA